MPTIRQAVGSVVITPVASRSTLEVYGIVSLTVLLGSRIVVFVGANHQNQEPHIFDPSGADSLGNAYTQREWADAFLNKPGGGIFEAEVVNAGANTITITCHAFNDNPIFDENVEIYIVAVEVTGDSPIIRMGATGMFQSDSGSYTTDIPITDGNGTVVTTGFGTTSQTVSLVADVTDSGGDVFLAANTNPLVFAVVPNVDPVGYFAYSYLTEADTSALLSWGGFVAAFPIISCDSPPHGVVGVAYTHTFPVTGGTMPFTFSITAGALPPGLTLDTTTGVVSGTPTTQGVYAFTIQVEDAVLATSHVDCSITIDSVLVTCDNPPTAQVGIPYSHFFPASGGTAPYTWVVSAGSLPLGLSLDVATGEVSGTPTTNGVSSFTIMITDAAANTATVTCSISTRRFQNVFA